jgi:hypothetical protein
VKKWEESPFLRTNVRFYFLKKQKFKGKIMNIIKVVIFIGLIFNFIYAEDKDLKNIFDKSKINGTLVIS